MGLFKRDAKGRTLGPICVEVERGRVRFFAEVLAEADPIHFDVAAARARGYPDLVAPPSFFMAIEALAAEEQRRNGRPPLADMIGADLRYVHGEEAYVYHGLVFAGDQVMLTAHIEEFYDKRGGALEFAVVRSFVRHARRGLLIEARRVFVHRLPEAARHVP